MANWSESDVIVMHKNIKYYKVWKVVCKDKWWVKIIWDNVTAKITLGHI